MSVRTLFATAVLSAAALLSVRADPGPETPDQGKEGQPCVINWTPDTTGKWTETAIELRTGDNWNMVHLTTVTTLDATKESTFTWTCPDVTINSAIYFYQFSAAGQNLTWTTRFAIAGADGSTVPPPETTQPDGQLIGWGTGALTDPSTAVAAPSWLSDSGSATGSSSVTVSGSTSASATGSSGSSSATGTSSSTASTGTTSSAASTSSGLTKVNSSTASKSSSAATTPSAGAANANPTGAPGGAASLHIPVLALSAVVGAFVFAI